ncbi:unnamed protein product [Prorocentrum cordatum]|uniref:Uncharacterized protein n=1 Tax=Prorocentrum cordatum TaxID=2364126 RepID=A0ABN9SQJ8_9DINO|nr:unnamed protein product [Polarella glacialis]
MPGPVVLSTGAPAPPAFAGTPAAVAAGASQRRAAPPDPSMQEWRGFPAGAAEEPAAGSGAARLAAWAAPLCLSGAELVPPLPPHLQPPESRGLPPAPQRPLPQPGGGDPQFNVAKCAEERSCDNPACVFWHSVAERRCQQFACGSCAAVSRGRCIGGLHVRPEDIREVLTVDLEDTVGVQDELRRLEAASPDERARYVRLVLYGFAGLRMGLLRKLLEQLPLLHELALPDRAREPSLLVFLCDLVEGLGTTTPRLRDVIFQDEQCESLW